MSKVTVKLEPALIYSLKVAVIFISPLKLKVPFEDVDKLDNSGATRSEIITKDEVSERLLSQMVFISSPVASLMVSK